MCEVGPFDDRVSRAKVEAFDLKRGRTDWGGRGWSTEGEGVH